MNASARREFALLSGAASFLLWACGRKSAAQVAAAAAGFALAWQSRPYSYRGRTVVITGGSRGLGFALARNLVRHGANVVLLARDAAELARAESQLTLQGSSGVLTIPCDITQPDQLRAAIAHSVDTFGSIDVWINDAGAILVGPLTAMVREDFDALLETQVRAVWTATQELLPIFRRAGGGRIVNISSIGGKLAVPHLGPYSVAKFALAGLSASLNAELAAENIKVTTVFPGLMRVGSAIQAVVKGEHEKEFAWFALGSITPLISVSADDAAARILRSVARGDAELVFPLAMKSAAKLQALFPELTALASQLASRLLPRETSPVGHTGAQSGALLERLPAAGALREHLERQQWENNEAAKSDARFTLGLDRPSTNS
jgi:short-subunit dehydrogenase